VTFKQHQFEGRSASVTVNGPAQPAWTRADSPEPARVSHGQQAALGHRCHGRLALVFTGLGAILHPNQCIRVYGVEVEGLVTVSKDRAMNVDADLAVKMVGSLGILARAEGELEHPEGRRLETVLPAGDAYAELLDPLERPFDGSPVASFQNLPHPDGLLDLDTGDSHGMPVPVGHPKLDTALLDIVIGDAHRGHGVAEDELRLPLELPCLPREEEDRAGADDEGGPAAERVDPFPQASPVGSVAKPRP